eukprot:TRINITY_DN290_c0_g2_i2.p1 TRINITY_DN290_c0_g2~~TRINITY_DN290_c0_g2_i2.p1  ORF type:complete len:131 (+),score=18.41 TRINITY_DN290_c0_g2_i2:52-393(+)
MANQSAPNLVANLQIEESLGARATAIAQSKATQWLNDTWVVIQKTVLDTAERGLFHCNIRFVDVIPQDQENQSRLLKILQKQNLRGTFKTMERDEEKGTEEAVVLTITWSPEL